MKINLNDKVRIKVKPEHNQYLMRNGYRPDASGFVEMQLHVVMNIFGLKMGAGYYSPIATEIEVIQGDEPWPANPD